MGKIGLKSSKIGKIAQKRDFTPDFTRSTENNNCAPLFPPAPGVKRVLAYWLLHSTQLHTTHSHRTKENNEHSSIFIFLHRLSHNTSQQQSKSRFQTTAFFILILLLSAVKVPTINHRSTTNNPLSHQPP